MKQKLLIVSLEFILFSCGYRVTKDLKGQTLIDQTKFHLNQPMADRDFVTIDTSAIYKKVVSNTWDYNEYLKFYGNGTYINVLKKTDFQPNDLNIDKNSVWRGRFILNDNKIKTEQFYPNQAPIKKYDRKILNGQVNGDTIIINWDNGRTKYRYVK